MSKIESFNIKKGDRIGNYKISTALGRGWEGEVYKCIESSTGAIRAIKLFPIEDGASLAYVMHYAWFLEEISHINLTPRYYHMGMEFDYEIYRFGFIYIVQELVEKNNIQMPVENASEGAIANFHEKLKAIHKLGYALGEWGTDNQFVDASGVIRKIDFNPGEENNPNTNQEEDIEWFNETFKEKEITY